jgi:hypothetical protein
MVLFWKKSGADHRREQIPAGDFLKRFLRSGQELVTIVGPEDGSCVCGDWVGAVVSISGESEEWPALLDAVEDGIFHEGCQHRLEAYSEENRVEAEFCTGLAVAAMNERMRQRRDEDVGPAEVASPTPQQEFAKLYDAAKLADSNGATDSALSKCEAALEMLNHRDVFGEDQLQIERVLEARIRGILSQRARNSETS